MSNVANSSSWTSFLKSITSFNGDLSSLTAPPFIISLTSLTEYSQYWAEHPNLLVEPGQGVSGSEDKGEIQTMALRRMISVTRWFISTLRSQYCSRSESLGTEKKPLNPFLGEVFVGKWEDETLGDTILLSEQTSHHPPVTSYYVENKKNQVTLQGYNRVKATISTASINIKQYGHAILNYESIGESYLITLPPLHIEGMITASPFVELEGTSYIQSSNGYIVQIDYSGRGYFSGKKNSFKARIYLDSMAMQNKGNALVTISGQWSGKSYINKGAVTPTDKANEEVFYDAGVSPKESLQVKPIAEQNPLESRKAWEKVAIAVEKGNYDEVHTEKSLIENEQREQRKREEEAGITWETRWFDSVDYEQEQPQDKFMTLAKLANLSNKNCPSGTLINSKNDKGDMKHWRFNREKWNQELEIKI